MEQIPHDVRGIRGVCESRLSQGALFRAKVQGTESGQDNGGLHDQVIRLSCPVPCHWYELQSGSQGTAHPLLGEEGDVVALQAGEVYHRPCEAEP